MFVHNFYINELFELFEVNNGYDSSHTFLNGNNCRIFNKINTSTVARNEHIDKCKPRDVRKRVLIGFLAFWIYD